MPTKHVVDTHALLWFLSGDARLGPAAKTVLDDPTSELIVPITALAEACWIIERGRTTFSAPYDFLKAISADARMRVVVLDRATVEWTLALNVITEMHDRQIVATALQLVDAGETVDLLTRDANIVASGLVPIVW